MNPGLKCKHSALSSVKVQQTGKLKNENKFCEVELTVVRVKDKKDVAFYKKTIEGKNHDIGLLISQQHHLTVHDQ